MATDTIPVFQALADAEPQFLVSYPHLGATYVVGFSTLNELIQIVVDYKDGFGRTLPTDLINLIVDFAEESMEWNERPPVAEAVTDFVSSCDCDACRFGINAEKVAELESDVRTLYRRVGFVLLAIGVAVWLF